MEFLDEIMEILIHLFICFFGRHFAKGSSKTVSTVIPIKLYFEVSQ